MKDTTAQIQQLAKAFHKATKEVIGSSDRHDIATMMLMGMCAALVAMYPEKANDGRSIIQVMSRQMLDFPVPGEVVQ